MNGFQIALTVVGGILLLLVALFAFGKAEIRIRAKKDFLVTLSVLGIRKKLISEKEDSPPKLTTCKNPKKVLRKERRRLKKLQRELEREKKKAEKKRLKKEKKKRKKQNQPKMSWKAKLEMVLALLKVIVQKTKGKFRLHLKKLQIAVATPDAARTAITYGIATQSVSYFLTWVDQSLIEIDAEDGAVNVYADFEKNETVAEIDLSCKIPLWRGLFIGIALLNAYRKEKQNALNQSSEVNSSENP